MVGRTETPRGAREATLVHRRDLGPTLAIFRFELEGGVPDFAPGQFLTLGLPDSTGSTGAEETTGRLLWRPYSIASPPEERRWVELYVRLTRRPEEPGHFTPLLFALAVGDRALWRGPKGRFGIADAHPDGTPDERRLLLLAGGTGLAPLLSCVLHLRAVAAPRPIVLGHGARHAAELGYHETLLELERESRAGAASLRFRYLPTISRPDAPENAGWTGHVGRVHTLLEPGPGGAPPAAEQALGGPLDPATTSAYVCGFEGTVVACLGALEPLGFRTRRDPRPDGSYDVRCESYG